LHGPIKVSYRVRMESSRASRPPKLYRGSRRRVRRARLRGNGSGELWLIVAWVVFLLLIVIPWMIRHQS